MLSLSSPAVHSLSTTTTNTSFLSQHPYFLSLHKPHKVTPLASSENSPPPLIPKLIIPKSSFGDPQPQNLYQPYRPPPNPLPKKYQNLNTGEIIEVLASRLGFWYEYAPLISSLFRDGFTPSSIEELTGISGVEQNRLVVAAQVRETIAENSLTLPETLAFFDNGGSEILYEIRLLSTTQRAVTANYIVMNKLDGAMAGDVAKSIRDFPGRQGLEGWECFDYTKPGDCWALAYFRQSKEFYGSEKRIATLETALEVAESEEAKRRLREEMEGEAGPEAYVKDDGVRVPVVRLLMGELAEATSVVVLPVTSMEDGENGVMSAPFECSSEGEFGVVVADRGWNRWVVLPRWFPVAEMGPGGVAVEFPSATKALPWRVNRNYEKEPVLVVADRGRREVEEDEGFYLVVEDGEMKVGRGFALKENGVKTSLGRVLVVVRPPKDEEDEQPNPEDWD